jgi:hypothetical protein
VRDLEYIDNFIGFRYPVVFHPVECPERILKRRISFLGGAYGKEAYENRDFPAWGTSGQI